MGGLQKASLCDAAFISFRKVLPKQLECSIGLILPFRYCSSSLILLFAKLRPSQSPRIYVATLLVNCQIASIIGPLGWPTTLSIVCRFLEVVTAVLHLVFLPSTQSSILQADCSVKRSSLQLLLCASSIEPVPIPVDDSLPIALLSS